MQGETTKEYLKKLISQSVLDLGFDLNRQDVSVPEPEFGDYSTNAALVLAKQKKQNPAELALKFIEKIQQLDKEERFSEIYEKGGFINFRLSQNYLLNNLFRITETRELYGASLAGQGKKILVEYFQPNVAKPLHLGHLRTAIIGDSLFRILSSQGYKVESDTHLGDWGTQFGILIWAYRNSEGKKLLDSYEDKVEGLNRLYVEAHTLFQNQEEVKARGKAEFVKLEQGDEENRKLWKQFRDWSWKEYEVVYNDLDVRKADNDWPESFYEDKMPEVVNELKAKGLLVESQGAQIVDLEKWGLGVAVVVKSDGGTTYLLRDLATFIFRKKQGFEKQLYVVDIRQSHTLKQTFKILELSGHITSPDEASHISFGFLTLPEGAMSTRKGTVVGAREFIEGVQKEALKIIEEKNPSLQSKEEVSKKVASAAIKYFDLLHNRKSDIVFDPKKALSFEGNTGPYLQYTHARIHGILRKAEAVPAGSAEELQATGLKLQDKELAVLRKLVNFPEVVARVAEDFLPNILANYLFELSQIFNTFYENVQVLSEQDDKLKLFRLQLISATAQVLGNGLCLLGVEAPEEM